MKHDVGVDECVEADGEVPLPIFRRGSNSGDPRDTEGSTVLLTNKKRMKLLDPTNNMSLTPASITSRLEQVRTMTINKTPT